MTGLGRLPGLVLAAALWSGGQAQASWLDSDFYCRTYGCVVVHDGVSFDVYDNYRFDGGGTVAPGERMVPWSGNPFQGVGGVNPVITGSRTEAFTLAPLVDESSMLGIDLDGDGVIEFQPTTNANGFFDASSVLPSFTLGDRTQLRASEASSQRSFYLSSRTDFYLSAEAILSSGNGVSRTAEQLSAVAFSYDLTLQGTDDGMSFGSAAHRGNSYRRLNSVTSLADLTGGPVEILEFRRDIRQRNASSLPEQSIRFDYVYGFAGYDLSMGVGRLQYEIAFDFYNR
ncbi:MAG: hypothetical protein AAFQ18_03080 [Pseudomonadota bacterium]